MELRRGDIVTIAPSGDFSKPRPALVLQAYLPVGMETVTVVPITSDLRNLPTIRVPINPSRQNGLRIPSEIMIDGIQTLLVKRIGNVIGTVEEPILRLVEASVTEFFGLNENL